MIYLFTAQYAAAKPWIEYFHLKKDCAQTRFQVFFDRASEFCLTVTGNGACASAAAVASVCTAYGVGKEDCLIHIGFCEHAEDADVFVCHQITEDATGRVFYPDMLYRHHIREAKLVTVPVSKDVLQGGQSGVFYETEAAAVYQAGNYFFGAHQMIFFVLAKKAGEEFPVEQCLDLARIVERYCANMSGGRSGLPADGGRQTASDGNEEENAVFDMAERLGKAMHCSSAMQASVLQHMRYARLSGVDVLAVERELYRQEILPCRNKREGKRCFEEWKKRLFAGAQEGISVPKTCKDGRWEPFFSHIYVEKQVKNHPRTERILEKFPNAKVIEIGHYKDVFCRGGQNPALQHRSQKLILASKQGRLLYPGAPVCQSFGNKNFYYVSCVMSCIFDCAYCYLKGMYPSGNIVVFVNLEDMFAEVSRRLEDMRSERRECAMYLCVSYDTDLLALEHLIGYTSEWLSFVRKHPGLTVEIRTKCADVSLFCREQPTDRAVFAFTLSPQKVVEDYERGTPSLAQRIACAAIAQKRGFAVRLCFDPMIYFSAWEEAYGSMLAQVFAQIDGGKLCDVSVGTFRVSQDYLKKMRKCEPDSAVVQFPYQTIRGVSQYPRELSKKMETFVTDRLMEYLPREKIWKDYGETDESCCDCDGGFLGDWP